MPNKAEVSKGVSQLGKLVLELPDGAGKSAVQHALNKLAQTVEESLATNGRSSPGFDRLARKAVERPPLPMGNGLAACC